MKTYLNFMAQVIGLVLLWSGVAYLVSEADTAAVIVGIVIAIMAFYLTFYFIKSQSIKAYSTISKITPVLLLVVAISPMLGGCVISYERVPAGNVLVVVNKYGSDKGVDVEVRGPGAYWLTYNQEGHLFPTFVQSPKWTADTGDDRKDQGFTCSTREGLAIGADIGAQYEFMADKIPVIFAKYRRGADELSDTVIRQLVADALVTECSKVSVESAYGEGRDALLNAVQDRVKITLDPQGVKVLSINWLGRPRLPSEVVTSITNKITATQQAQQRVNEVQSVIAEADKAREMAKGDADAVLTRANAEAKANEIIAKSLTPELVKYRSVYKWNGELPRVSSGVVPFIQLDEKSK